MHFCLKYRYLRWFISCDKHSALMLLKEREVRGSAEYRVRDHSVHLNPLKGER